MLAYDYMGFPISLQQIEQTIFKELFYLLTLISLPSRKAMRVQPVELYQVSVHLAK
jgi:predicted amino acid-binding ACT domain protein